MKGFQPLMQDQKFTEAETLLDHAIDLASKSAAPAQTGPPLSLQRKVQCLQAQVQKWQEEGKAPRPIGEIMQDFQPLAEQQEFPEAEAVVDRALKVAGSSCGSASNRYRCDASCIAAGENRELIYRRCLTNASKREPIYSQLKR